MVSGSGKHPDGEYQRGLFDFGEEGRGMATEPAGVSGDVSAGETSGGVSQDGDGLTRAAGRSATGGRFSGPDQSDLERLKLCAARSIWLKQNELTPSRQWTWGEWFHNRFGITLYDYAEAKKQERSDDK